ncbi:hypothetical protein LTS18_012178 [Coniosporium uncinatum]|uniref:Uncharacterized protein n=1 Tax=Coniosporium uncinatum TaxID=93489 RepID=A0ACC3D9G1_9PEZI|nr:hypothetical protein LTS18_012178 [Coniosporium uncinatum]
MDGHAPKTSIRITHRTDKSIPMSILMALIKPFGSKLVSSSKDYPPGSPRLTVRKAIQKSCSVTERKVNDIYLYDIKRPAPLIATATKKPPRRKRIYYFAGGGWHMPPSGQHWESCRRFAHEIPNATITIVSYPLAPHSPAPDAFPQLMKLYRTLLAQSHEDDEYVILAGDSSGGNIVLAIALEALREEPDSLAPDALLAICPSVDMCRDNKDMEEVERHDPLLSIDFTRASAKGWVGDWENCDPKVSPLQADVEVLKRAGVRCHGLTAGYDVLSPDGILFRDKCAKAGVEGEWLQWERQMHCWALAWIYGLSESRDAMRWMVELLKREGSEDA